MNGHEMFAMGGKSTLTKEEIEAKRAQRLARSEAARLKRRAAEAEAKTEGTN